MLYCAALCCAALCCAVLRCAALCCPALHRVCTLASNWCRVVDELRVTVGGQVNGLFADLSEETCKLPPCIGSNVYSFDWR